MGILVSWKEHDENIKKDERNQERIVEAIQKLKDANQLLTETDPGASGEEAGDLIDEATTILEEIGT